MNQMNLIKEIKISNFSKILSKEFYLFIFKELLLKINLILFIIMNNKE